MAAPSGRRGRLTLKTDDQGVARFDALPAGEYQVVATDGDERSLQEMTSHWPWPRRDGYEGMCHGITIARGQTRRFTMAICRRFPPTRFQVRQAAGRWAADCTHGFDYSHAGSSGSAIVNFDV